MRRRAHAPHNPANVKRISDSMSQAVSSRDFELKDGARIITSDLECDDGEVRAVECCYGRARRRRPQKYVANKIFREDR
jgi:hypothetical protein